MVLMKANESMTTTLADGRVIRVAKFHNEAGARRASAPGMKSTMFLGDIDDPWGKYWVVLNRYAGALERAGFERA
jgi:hypothetical protein